MKILPLTEAQLGNAMMGMIAVRVARLRTAGLLVEPLVGGERTLVRVLVPGWCAHAVDGAGNVHLICPSDDPREAT